MLRALLARLGSLRPEIVPVEFEDLESIRDLAHLPVEPFPILLEAVDPQFREVELGAEPEEFLVPLGDQGGGPLPAVLLFLEFSRQGLNLCGEFGDFAPVAQEALFPGAVRASARQDAVRADDIPLRGDEGAAEAVLLPERDAVDEARDEQDVAQELVDDGPIVLLHRDPFDQRHRLPEVLEGGPGGGMGPDLEGDEAPPSERGALEVIDSPNAVGLAFHHDVLELLPEDRLDGRLILPGHPDVVGDETQEEFTGELLAAGPFAAGHEGLDPFVAPGVTLFEFLQRGEPRRFAAALLAEFGDPLIALRQLAARPFELVGDLLAPSTELRDTFILSRRARSGAFPGCG